MKNPKIYVLLNSDLEMSAGKAAAQTAHAVMMLNEKSREDFMSDHQRTVYVVEATGDQIKNLHIYLDDTDFDSDYYIDEGENEVPAYSVTAMAVFIGDNEEARSLFKGFELFSGYYKSIDEIAIKYLNYVVESREGMGMILESNIPRYVNKTLKWLKENK